MKEDKSELLYDLLLKAVTKSIVLNSRPDDWADCGLVSPDLERTSPTMIYIPKGVAEKLEKAYKSVPLPSNSPDPLKMFIVTAIVEMAAKIASTCDFNNLTDELINLKKAVG